MAKENREAGHMLGDNEPKKKQQHQNNRETGADESGRDRISQQAAQATIQSNPAYE